RNVVIRTGSPNRDGLAGIPRRLSGRAAGQGGFVLVRRRRAVVTPARRKPADRFAPCGAAGGGPRFHPPPLPLPPPPPPPRPLRPPPRRAPHSPPAAPSSCPPPRSPPAPPPCNPPAAPACLPTSPPTSRPAN